MTSRAVPMFPLGTVLFPHATLPLHVFEPRYRAMTRAVLGGDQEFGVVLIERGNEVGGGDVRFGVGTLARVVSASELPDGRYALLAVGVARFRVEGWLAEEPYPRAEIVELSEPEPPAEVAAMVGPVASALGSVLDLFARVQGIERVPLPALSNDPEQAAYEMAALIAPGPLDAQRLLELPDTRARLANLGELLADLDGVLRARLGDTGPN